ncbi:hypothetical protein TPAU25S_02105 [Tsukamurella paurometabola]
MTPRITTSINNTVIEQGDIDAWESRRARAVVRKLARHLGQRGFREATGDNPANLVALPADDLRAALTAAKLALGPVGTYAMLKRELAASERVARVGAHSAGSRSPTRLFASRTSPPMGSPDGSPPWSTRTAVSRCSAPARTTTCCAARHLVTKRSWKPRAALPRRPASSWTTPQPPVLRSPPTRPSRFRSLGRRASMTDQSSAACATSSAIEVAQWRRRCPCNFPH